MGGIIIFDQTRDNGLRHVAGPDKGDFALLHDVP
jgi:hypothetical protein